MKKTTLLYSRGASPKEKEKGAEIVFVRGDENDNEHTIYGRALYGSWEQWGTIPSILGDNVEDIERWKRNRVKA